MCLVASQVQQKLLIVERAYLFGATAMRAHYAMEAIRAAAGLSNTEPPSQLMLDDQATVADEEGGGYWGEQCQSGAYRDIEAGSVAGTRRTDGMAVPSVAGSTASALMRSDDGSSERQPLL